MRQCWMSQHTPGPGTSFRERGVCAPSAYVCSLFILLAQKGGLAPGEMFLKGEGKTTIPQT